MLKYIYLFITLAWLGCLGSIGFFKSSNSYKCLVKMNDYKGKGAYVVTSLINPKGEYEETLYVNGQNDNWFNKIISWKRFYEKKGINIDAISGATIRGGEQQNIFFKVGNDKINTGYKIRFETAVEDQDYYEKDVEFNLSSQNVLIPINGTGFIESIQIQSDF